VVSQQTTCNAEDGFSFFLLDRCINMSDKTYVAKCACKCDNCDNKLLKNRHKYGTIEVPCRASLQSSPLLFNLCQSTVLTEIAILGRNTYFLPVVSMLCSW
jgi:hypothetical protein